MIIQRPSNSFAFMALVLTALLGVDCRSRPTSETWHGNRGQTTVTAAVNGDLDLLKKLEASGESLDFQDHQIFNWTPLIAAIYHQKTNITYYLLTKKINLNLQDRDGETALMWAITTEDSNTVKLLLERGADVTITNRAGVNAFGLAGKSSHRVTFLNLLNEHKPQRQ